MNVWYWQRMTRKLLVPMNCQTTTSTSPRMWRWAKAIDERNPCYFAVHGYPNRNDDYYTIARVTEQEYDEMVRVYAPLGSQSNPTAETFRNKYVEKHTQVYEGWDLPDVLWV